MSLDVTIERSSLRGEAVRRIRAARMGVSVTPVRAVDEQDLPKLLVDIQDRHRVPAVPTRVRFPPRR